LPPLLADMAEQYAQYNIYIYIYIYCTKVRSMDQTFVVELDIKGKDLGISKSWIFVVFGQQ
jgi:hypothetical protein